MVKKRIKNEIGYAILSEMCSEIKHLEYCFTWDKKHPEEKNQKSERIYAIYPTRKQALADKNFRGNCIIKKIILK